MKTSPDKNPWQQDSLHQAIVYGELQQRAREIFSGACADTDLRTQTRLSIARREALAAARHPSRRRIWLPAAGAAAACVLVLGVIWMRPVSSPDALPPTQQVASNDAALPLNADGEQLEMYQNLDFYQWLAQQSVPQAPQSGANQ